MALLTEFGCTNNCIKMIQLTQVVKQLTHRKQRKCRNIIRTAITNTFEPYDLLRPFNSQLFVCVTK